MPLRLYTAPASEPVTLDEAKDHLRYEEEIDQPLIAAQIIAARQWAEQYCWRGIVSQTWELTLPGFRGEDRFDLPARGPVSVFPVSNDWNQGAWTNGGLGAYRFLPYLELPRGNLDVTAPISLFTYVDPNGATQTVSTSVYDVDVASVPGRLRLKFGQVWPDTREQWNAVVIRFQVGWAVADIPQALKQAILLQVSAMYEERNPAAVQGLSTAEALCDPYRLIRI